MIAGYINKGENVKETLVREIKEEVGSNVEEYMYNDHEYFKKTNTLIHNYTAIVDSEDYVLNDEVLDNIMSNSLAKSFVERFLKKVK